MIKPFVKDYTAALVFINETQCPIASVSLVCQYGDERIHRHSWSHVHPNQMSTTFIPVHYKCGPSKLTKKTRFFVSWFSGDFETVHVASNSNHPDTLSDAQSIRRRDVRYASKALSNVLYYSDTSCPPNDIDSTKLKNVSKLPSQSIVDGTEYEKLTTLPFKFGRMDDMKNRTIVYLTLKENGTLVLTSKSGSHTFDVYTNHI